jgi:hypothetical protein
MNIEDLAPPPPGHPAQKIPTARERQTGVTLEGDDAVALTEFERTQAVAAAHAATAELRRAVKRSRDDKGKLRRARYVAEVLALRMTLAPGKNTPADIAKVLGTSPASVGRVLQMVRDDASLPSQLDRLDTIAMPLAVDNVIRGIIAGDKAYTMKFMDGRGLFRVHKSIEAQITQTTLTFTVEMKMPEHLRGQPLPPPLPGAVVGASILTARNGAPAGSTPTPREAELLPAPLGLIDSARSHAPEAP